MVPKGGVLMGKITYDLWHWEHSDRWTVDLWDEMGYMRTQHFGTERAAMEFIEESGATKRENNGNP